MSTHDTGHPAAGLGPIERLVAIEEIRRLKAHYWRFVDTKQWEAFGSLFAEDATFTDHAGGPFHCNGKAEIQGKISVVLEKALTIHQGHQSEIDIEDATNARGIHVMEDYLIFPSGDVHPTNPFPEATVRGYGHYVERYVKVGGEWLFKKVDLYRLRLEVETPSSTAYPAIVRGGSD